VRVDSGVAPPVEQRDLVLAVASIPTAGLSVEQVEQLAIFDDVEPSVPRSVVVLREGEALARNLTVPTPVEPERAGEEGGVLPTDWVLYGDGSALVVDIGDVPDDLGDLLAVTIARARATRVPVGIVLDLRGNGGGSTDGANAALGLFLPGVPLFPMKRRDGVIETERAPEPPETDRWPGPVAALVDGDTASAAEMIAGALASYRRGVVAGFRTYGKGCAQEYLDDDAHSGVLRLTTLIYALPDGTPVQRVGLLPGLNLGPKVMSEREATLAHSLSTWRGPDVRDRERVAEVPWPGHHGHLGPCRDDAICRALRALGAPRTAVARGRR
jgi:carboxyl-terminal processing protease